MCEFYIESMNEPCRLLRMEPETGVWVSSLSDSFRFNMDQLLH